MMKFRARDIFASLMENQRTKVHPSRYGRYNSGARSKISRLRRAKTGRELGKYTIADRPWQLDLLTMKRFETPRVSNCRPIYTDPFYGGHFYILPGAKGAPSTLKQAEISPGFYRLFDNFSLKMFTTIHLAVR